MIGRVRHRPWILKRLLVLAVAGGLVWCGWKWWDTLRDRVALARVLDDMQVGRHGAAAHQLTVLLTRRPDWDEAAYLLGVCEKARGRLDPAAAAWARVRPGSAFITRAVLGRADLLAQLGRQSDAEQLVLQALAEPGSDGSSLRWFLVPLYWQQGRVDEARRLLESTWDHLDRSVDSYLDQTMKLVQDYLRLDREEESAPGFRRSVVEQAGRLAPEDDRIWLARGSMAIDRGAFDEAAQWLAACLRKRPEDVPAWKAYLRWAMGTDRFAEVRKALERLPATDSTPAQVDRLAAWLAAHRGDAAAERRALERVVADAPADFAAWDRLADLARQTGRLADAAELRRKKAELERVRDRYRERLDRNQPMRDAPELARLAEQLGHWFEARVFLTLATEMEPARGDIRGELARLRRKDVVEARPGCTLAELLATELDPVAAGPGVPATIPNAASPPL
jgi:tetratricopeptide (TPR) repeat protein